MQETCALCSLVIFSKCLRPNDTFLHITYICRQVIITASSYVNLILNLSIGSLIITIWVICGLTGVYYVLSFYWVVGFSCRPCHFYDFFGWLLSRARLLILLLIRSTYLRRIEGARLLLYLSLGSILRWGACIVTSISCLKLLLWLLILFLLRIKTGGKVVWLAIRLRG